MDSDFLKAATYGINSLLNRELFDINTSKLIKAVENYQTPIQALNNAIRSGGGHTFEHNIGSYWMVEYWPGIKISIVKCIDEKIITEQIPKKIVISIAKNYIANVRAEHRQLELF